MEDKSIKGYFFALSTIAIWGTAYVFTKKLLMQLTPVEILFFRFLLAFLILLIVPPKFNLSGSIKEELYFLLLGLLGVTAYFLLENTALLFTQASNVALIVSSIPIFTALISNVFFKDGSFHKGLIYGFIIAISGIFLVIYNGNFVIDINPYGDILAFLCAIIFALYSSLLNTADKNLSPIIIVRKTFFYGLLTMLPILLYYNNNINITVLWDFKIIINLLFLSLLSSITAFILWNKAIKLIGSVKTSSFIYLVPLITMISSFFFLNEIINIYMVLGGILILSGVYVSER